MPKGDLFVHIIYPTIVVLGTGIIIFICSRIYKRIKKNRKDENLISDELLKKRILFEITGNARFFIEVGSTNTYLFFSLILVTNDTDTVIIRDIEVIMGGCIGKLAKEKTKKFLYHSEKEQRYTVENKISFPFALTPNTPKDIALTFLFTDPSIVVGKFDIKLYTSLGEFIIPASVEIER